MKQMPKNNAASMAPLGYPMQQLRPGAARLLDAAGDQWLQGRRPAVKDSTYVKYEAIWRRHIKPALGGMDPASIDGKAVKSFIQGLSEQGLAPKTVRDILSVLRSILVYAASQGWDAPAFFGIRCPKEPRKPIRVLSRQEQDRLARYLYQDMDCCRFGVLLALLTGMRIGEVCALKWRNVSLPQRLILVDATMQRLRVLDGDGAGKTHVVIGSPKSDAAVRAIPMSDHVAALCRQIGPFGPDCFVLTGTERYMEPRLLQFRMKRYAADCGLQNVHFHTLRHTFATRSVEVGFELKSLSEILGHANTSITLDLYVHLSMEQKIRNMNKLAQAGL